MRWRMLAAAALSLAPLPAAADVTARYQLDRDALTIEVDDNGDYRAEIAGKFMLMRRSGAEYVVIFQGATPHVVERKAFFDLVETKLRGELAKSTEARRDLVLTKGSEEEIAGRRGTLWTVALDKPGGNRIEAVIAPDADLAPVSAVFAGLLDGGLQVFGGLIPESNLPELLREVFAKGAPLRLAMMVDLRLNSVSKAPIDSARFALPGPVVDAAAFERALSGPNAKTEVAVPPPSPTP